MEIRIFTIISPCLLNIFLVVNENKNFVIYLHTVEEDIMQTQFKSYWMKNSVCLKKWKTVFPKSSISKFLNTYV